MNIIIYEPTVNGAEFQGIKVTKSLKELKEISDIIVANRDSTDLDDVIQKVYTRDIYSKD